MKNCFYTLLAVMGTIHWSNAKTFTPEIVKGQLCGPLQLILSDTAKIKEFFRENNNVAVNDRLKPIRANFKRINSITQWSSVKKKDLEGESVFYEQKGRLEKITARLYGETGQVFTEYYLLNGHLSFVFEKEYTYNRPLFYDVKAMKENNDTEAFDFKKSKIREKRNYFEKGKLIHITNSPDSGAHFSIAYIDGEQKRISEAFQKLLKLRKEK